jgi:FtsP/CotA-like multicopper oxidase with cupredoxin domain
MHQHHRYDLQASTVHISACTDTVAQHPTVTASPSAAAQPSHIYYSGAEIVGTAQLPPSLSSIVFPSIPVSTGIPAHSGSLGVSNLDQELTNGNSLLGTLLAPKYGLFNGDFSWESNSTLSNSTGAPAGGFPWGARTASGTNPYTNAPVTGVVRTYNFVISRANLAPDGVVREMLLVNGQFPGPTIEANWGDTIQVTVTNNIVGPEEGTAMHWHGLLQQGTPYEDGVPGITQCPIAPGQTFTYTFNADLYGSSWYHSHYSAQYAGGVFGAIIIHGPQNALYTEDLGPVLLSDYFHADYYTLVEDVMSTDFAKITPFSDNNMINGKGVYDCSKAAGSSCTPNAGLSKFQFVTGETYRLRLVNTGAEATQLFSIDQHSLTVIAYDFVPIVPYTTNVVTLGVGQRADVVVQANGAPGTAVWMRSTMASGCSHTHQPNGLAIVYYEGADTTSEPTSQAWPVTGPQCANDPLSKTIPYAPIAPPQSQTTVTIDLNFEINGTGHFLFTMDGSTFRTDYNSPILPLAVAGNYSYPEEWNVYNFGSNKSFTVVIQNQTPLVHPMHIHGHNMFVLNQGQGRWDGSVVRPANPMRRDVVQLMPGGYMAFQIDANNPGVWPFHCHIAWHVSGGLYVNLLVSFVSAIMLR